MALVNPLSTDPELKSLVNIALQMKNSGHPEVRTTDGAATLLYYIALDLAASLSGNVTQTQLNKEISDRSLAIQDILRTLTPHVNNATVHITAAERQQWSGLTSAYVFADAATMNAWIAANRASLSIGNLLYIQDASGTCYWWDGTTARVRPSSTIINDFYTKGQIDSQIALVARDNKGSRFFKDSPKAGNTTLIELVPADGLALPAAVTAGAEYRILVRALYADETANKSSPSASTVKVSIGALGTYPLYTSFDGQGVARGSLLPGQIYTVTFTDGAFVLTDADVGIGRAVVSDNDTVNGILDLRKFACTEYIISTVSGEIKKIFLNPGSLVTIYVDNDCFFSPITGNTAVDNAGRALHLKQGDRVMFVGTYDGSARLVNYQRLATGFSANSAPDNEVTLTEEQLYVRLGTDIDGQLLEHSTSFGLSPRHVYGTTRVNKTEANGPHTGFLVTPDGIECGPASENGGVPSVAFNAKFCHAKPNAGYVAEKSGLPPGAVGFSFRNGVPCLVWNDNGILKYSGANLAWTTL